MRTHTGRAYWLAQAEPARGRPEAQRLVEWIATTARADTERRSGAALTSQDQVNPPLR
jgi:hypothetical protein